MERITKEQRSTVIDILTQAKPTMEQKRHSLIKAGIPKIAVDEIELLYEVCEWIRQGGKTFQLLMLSCCCFVKDEEWEVIPFRLKKMFPSLYDHFIPYLQEIKKTMELAALCGVTSNILIRPLMVGRRHDFHKNGICFEVVKRNKRLDILAAGGRYVL